jgi:hypothetical protein
MAQGLSGQGQLLPPPQALYPASLVNAPSIPATNTITLAPGQAIPVPPSGAGEYIVEPGGFAIMQWFDPVTLSWRGFNTSRGPGFRVASDGFNIRVFNPLGCPVAAIVTTLGTAGSYAQSSTTVAPSSGNSTWQAIIGGAINPTITSTFGSLTSGIGYGVAPLVFIPSPPPPGVSASAIAVISASGSSVTSLTVVNQGAGYPSAPPLLFLPNPFDPNVASGTYTTPAVATVALEYAGRLTAVLCTNSGVSLSAMPSLTITGAGASATATVVPMWTVNSGSTTITAGGGNATAGIVMSAGGQPIATAVMTNPATELTGAIPRQYVGTAGPTGTLASIAATDSGLFFGSPTMVLAGTLPTTVTSITPTLGTVNATIILQPT